MVGNVLPFIFSWFKTIYTCLGPPDWCCRLRQRTRITLFFSHSHSHCMETSCCVIPRHSNWFRMSSLRTYSDVSDTYEIRYNTQRWQKYRSKIINLFSFVASTVRKKTIWFCWLTMHTAIYTQLRAENYYFSFFCVLKLSSQ